LSQFNNKGIEHPCAYAIWVLTQADTNYSPCHLEASGLQWSTRHFRPYLIGRHFTIRTDHKPLVSLNKTHSLALERIYAELIDSLPFTIEYLQGNKMPAGGLSRLGQMVSDLAQLNLKNNGATESEWRLNATSDQIYSMQKDDKYVKALVCYLKFGKLPDSNTLRAFVLKLANRAVFRLGIVEILQHGEFLTLALLVLRPTLISLAHNNCLSGHMGSDKTRIRLQQSWFWPGMRSDVQLYCQSFQKCQTVNPGANMKPALQEAMNTATHVNARCHVDLIGPFPLSKNKNKYLLVMIDAFSSYVECVPTPNKEAATIYQAFLSGWVAQHSFCDRLNSDLGSKFHNGLLKGLSAKMGFKHTFSSIAYPTSNGQVERANRSILTYMKKFITENGQWESMLPALKFALNSAPHATKRYSPFQILYG
jgi:putative transposase